jgi:hypothetical protein
MEDGASWDARIDVELGRTLGDLLIGLRDWLVRQSETIELVDAYTIRRSIRLEIDPARAVAPGSAAPELFPLLFLTKELPPWLEVTDESGNPLPFLTPTEALEACVSLICASADEVLGHACSPETARLLGAMVGAPHPDDVTAARADLEKATEVHPEVRQLLSDASFSAKLDTLGAETIVIAPLRDHRRQIVTTSYLENLLYPSPARRLQESLGWARLPFEFPLPAVGSSETYELYVTAPSGFRIVDAEVVVPSEDSASAADVSVARLQDRVQFRISSTAREHVGAATFTMLPARAGLVRMMALSCAVIAAVLTIVQQIGLREVVDFSQATSILLGVPGVVGLVSAQSTEHPFFTKRMAALRAVVTVCAVTSYAAAFQVATGVMAICLGDSLCLRPRLSWWVVVAWTCVALLLPGFVNAGRGRAGPQSDALQQRGSSD